MVILYGWHVDLIYPISLRHFNTWSPGLGEDTALEGEVCSQGWSSKFQSICHPQLHKEVCLLTLSDSSRQLLLC